MLQVWSISYRISMTSSLLYQLYQAILFWIRLSLYSDWHGVWAVFIIIIFIIVTVSVVVMIIIIIIIVVVPIIIIVIILIIIIIIIIMDGLPFPDTGCPVPDVSIYYMSNINELPDGILFHWFCKCTPPWMFLPLDIPSEYRPEHVTFGLLCVIFKFPSRIFCRRVPGFATDCPCGVWCRGLTTCLLYVGPPLEF